MTAVVAALSAMKLRASGHTGLHVHLLIARSDHLDPQPIFTKYAFLRAEVYRQPAS